MAAGDKRGFASMNQERQREIASMGGRAAHEKGTAHEFTTDEARAAGRKGGEAVSRDRAHMAAIGRKGGEARSESRGRSGQRAGGAGGKGNAGGGQTAGRNGGHMQSERGNGHAEAQRTTNGHNGHGEHDGRQRRGDGDREHAESSRFGGSN